MGVLNILLVFLAAVLGADSAFAMADVTVVTGATEKVEDSKGLATQMPGVGASQSEAVESDFTPEEIDQAIAEFQAYQTPVEASISALAEKVNVDGYEIIHYRSATPVFTVKTINSSPISSGAYGPGQELELTIGTDISKKNARLLYECKNIYIKEGTGYDGATGNKDGMLACYVLSNEHTNGGSIKLLCLNCDERAQAASGVQAQIPATSTLIIGAVAASESQREVAPDNFEPVPTTVYLQKRVFNIVMTLEWINGKKKVKFAEEDMRKGALYAYKVGNEITDLIGTQKKFKVEGGRQMGDEYVYTSKGILRQVNMYYSYEDGHLTAEDLTAIAQMQFTKFSANREAQVFCGQNFISCLLNMDLTIHKEIKFEDVSFMGMTVRGWKNNFGQLNFVYCPVFDLLGFDNCALVVDVRSARNYVKKAPSMETVDMRQGAAETRDAKRDIYSQIYGIALRGYNAMFVGPATELSNIAANFSNFTVTVSTVTALPTSSISVTTVYYLSQDDTTAGFNAHTFVKRNEANTAWELYSGPIQRV